MSHVNIFKQLTIILLVSTSNVFCSSCTPRTYPHLVAFKTAYDNQACGGFLLNSRWVVTAAHCVYRIDYLNKIKIHGQLASQNSHRIEHVYLQDTYDPKTIQNDVAMLYLHGPIASSKYGELAGKEMMDHYISNKRKSVEVVTWKINKPPRKIKSSEVLETLCSHADIGDTKYCNRVFLSVVYPETMFCILPDPTVGPPCQGDSGTPIFYKNLVLGVVSFGGDCGLEKKAPFVYARIDTAIEFISKTVASRGDQLKTKKVDGFDVYYIVETSKGSTKKFSFVLLSTIWVHRTYW